MNALTLFSVVAPVAPNVPNGPSAEAASGFQSLLAALSVADPAPEAATFPEAGNTEAEPEAAEAPTVAGVLAQTLAPPPLALLVAATDGDAQTASPVDRSTPDTDPAPAPPVAAGSEVTRVAPDPEATLVAPPAAQPSGPPAAQPASQPVGEVKIATKDSGQPQTWPLAPSTAGEKLVSPPVQPRLHDAPAIAPAAGEASDLLTKTDPTTAVAEAVARLPAAPPPPAAPPSALTPAPLRPLAERGSGPADLSAGAAADETGLTGPRPNAATGSPSPAPGITAPAPSIDRTRVAVVADAVDSGDTDVPASDLPPLEEGAPTQTQGAAATRDAPASQLSRATIEATAQIAAQILRRLEGRSTRFEMALTPDELGRVDVRLDIDSEGRLNARLAFDNPAAATDLRGRADELRRELEDAGFHLADDAFEFADRDSNSSAFDRGQDGRHGSSRAFAAASRLNAEIDVAQPPAWLALSLSPSGVDMKV